jgi:GTP-sensing pleiotropic transcriptional regulator CodY
VTLEPAASAPLSVLVAALCAQHGVHKTRRVLCVAIFAVLNDLVSMGRTRIIAQDLVERLGRDKTAVSNGLRDLERIGVIERTGKLGPSGRPIKICTQHLDDLLLTMLSEL